MNRLAYLALICAGLFWGMGFPLGKLVMAETDAAHMILLRMAIAAVAALPFALASREARALFRSPVVLFGGVIYGLAYLVQFEGLARTSVTFAALLVGAQPAFIAVGARLAGDKVSRLSWVGIAAACLGALLIAGRPGPAGTPLGIALNLAALFLFLAWLMLMRKAPHPPNPMALPAITVIVGALTLLPVALILHGPPKLDLSAAAWMALLAQGLLGTLAATACWQYGVAAIGPARAGVFINIEPLIGSLIGVTLFGDHLTITLALGGLAIIAGSLAVVLGETHAPLDTDELPPTLA